MRTNAAYSKQFESSLKGFAQYIVDLHTLPTFDSVSKAEGDAYERLEIGLEEMDSKEIQIVLLMQQLAEIYSRDRQMHITGENPYEAIIEMDSSAMKNGHFL